MKPIIEKQISILQEILPRHLEEGNWAESVGIDEIEQELVNNKISFESSQLFRQLVERLFLSLSLLDKTRLAEGRWKFVSFPAYLVAQSILSTLSERDASLFREGYWEQGAHQADADVEEQRSILNWLESRRVRLHPENHAQPIRYVYVAWGLIKIGGKFLLLHREDKSRSGVGNYVIPGGRFNMNDLPQPLRTDENIRQIFQPSSQLATQYLAKTLERELDEQLRLIGNEHYVTTLPRNLKPYRKIEGARNNLSLTEYYLQLFHINLTLKGEVHLYNHLLSHDEFAWFSPDELAKTVSNDGKTAFIDALMEEFGDSFLSEMVKVPESIKNTYRFSMDTDAVDFPFSVDGLDITQGKTGKERPIQVSLDTAEQDLLLGLACHARGMALQSHNGIRLLPYGWVRIEQESLSKAVSQLATKLTNAGLPILEIRESNFVRVNIDPSQIYINSNFYRYTRSDKLITVIMPSVETPIGAIAPVNQTISLSPKAQHVIECMEKGNDPDRATGDIEKTFRDQIDKFTRPLGLRKFLRMDGKRFLIGIHRET